MALLIIIYNKLGNNQPEFLWQNVKIISMVEKNISYLLNSSGKKPPFLMAHRGNRVLFPENTLAAFRQAVKDDADIIETDLHLSKDGQFMCIHDSTVDRTMNGTGSVREKTLSELKQLRAAGKNSTVTDEEIPTLEEIADFLPENIALALELKTDQFLDREVCSRLGKLLNDRGVLKRSIVLSFNLERLEAVKKEIPEIPIGWISMTRLVPDKPVDLIGSFWPAFYLNPWYVRMAHKRGILTCPLDPTPDSRLGYYLRLGVDAVLSDDPGKTRRELDRLSD